MRKDFLHRCNATASYALLQIMCWGFYAVSLCFSSKWNKEALGSP